MNIFNDANKHFLKKKKNNSKNTTHNRKHERANEYIRQTNQLLEKKKNKQIRAIYKL